MGSNNADEYPNDGEIDVVREEMDGVAHVNQKNNRDPLLPLVGNQDNDVVLLELVVEGDDIHQTLSLSEGW